jgi:UDP-N-acetylglucosamine 1-carboxyvinyltransferase
MILNMKNLSTNQEQLKIGQFIAHLREERGLTQEEFAKHLKTSQSAVARMEKGEQNFSTETLSKISTVLKREVITLADNSISLKIEGGHKLSGAITTNSSKNAAMGLMCAALLNSGKTTLRNMPKIEEVNRIIEVLTSIGVLVRWQGVDLEIQPPKKIALDKINHSAAIKTRSIIMMMGPLAHLFKHFTLPLAGGCKLGERTIRPHLFALEKLGITIKTHHDNYEISSKKLSPTEIILYEMGDTVTENIIMAAAKIPGITTVKLASSNYMVQDVCFFLEKLGIRIDGVGTSTLVIHGKQTINQNVEYFVSEDPIESMMFISLAAATQSFITIERCPIDFLELELLKLEKMGFKYSISKRYKSRNGYTNLVDIKTQPSKFIALEEKIHPLPSNQGINIDNLPFFIPIATQAVGKTLIQDWVYENRAIYFMEMTKLRADMTLVDPHRVYIEGPTELRAAEVVCPPALRPAVIILIGMLAAKGTSILRNIYSISRGYEDLANRLKKIGAKIEIIHGF